MTQPTCAACLLPITGRASFVIAGTEVVHKQCVGQETVGWRTKRRVADLEQTAAKMGREVPMLRADVTRLEEQMRLTVREMAKEADRIRDQRDAERGISRALRQEALDRATENASLRRQLDQTLQDLQAALLRAHPSEPVQREEGLDDSALRFSLLELDGT